MLEKSYIYGPLILLTVFLFILVLSLGVKALYLTAKTYYLQKNQPKPKIKRKTVPKPSKPSTIRSIEINPEEIDRIYVKR